jgi:hypothetical protein
MVYCAELAHGYDIGNSALEDIKRRNAFDLFRSNVGNLLNQEA